MKNLSIIALSLSLLQIVHAQDDSTKEKYLIGGAVSFVIQNNSIPLSYLGTIRNTSVLFSYNVGDSKYITFAFNPYFGKQLTPHLIVGCMLDYRLEHRNYETLNLTPPVLLPNNIYEINSDQIGFGIFTRYLLNPEDKFNFFLEPRLNYNISKETSYKNAIEDRVEKANFIEIGSGAGVLYNINHRIRAILKTAGITYINGSWEEVGKDKKNSFNSLGARVDFSSFYLGFEVKF